MPVPTQMFKKTARAIYLSRHSLLADTIVPKVAHLPGIPLGDNIARPIHLIKSILFRTKPVVFVRRFIHIGRRRGFEANNVALFKIDNLSHKQVAVFKKIAQISPNISIQPRAFDDGINHTLIFGSRNYLKPVLPTIIGYETGICDSI